jgi:hypothetical protein
VERGTTCSNQHHVRQISKRHRSTYQTEPFDEEARVDQLSRWRLEAYYQEVQHYHRVGQVYPQEA